MTNTVNVGQLFGQYEADRIQPVPAGDYDIEVTHAKAKPEKAQIVTTCKVLSGPYAGQKVMFGPFTFDNSNAAASIAFQNLAGFGLTKEYFVTNPTLEQVAAALVGRKVQVVLEVKTWNNQDRNQLKIGAVKLIEAPLIPAGAGVPQVAPPQVAPAPVMTPPAQPAPEVAPAAPPAQPPAPPAAPPVAPPPPEQAASPLTGSAPAPAATPMPAQAGVPSVGVPVADEPSF